MIPLVSLGCGRGGSLSQLSLDGLMLPGQVYSAVTPWAGGASWAGHESPGLLSAGPPLDFVTLWPHLAAPPPCMHLLNTATKHIPGCRGMKVDSQNFRHLWPRLPFSDFNSPQPLSYTLIPLVPLYFINVWSRPVFALTCRRQNQTEGDVVNVSHFPPSPPRSQWKHHGILTCRGSAASPGSAL